MPHAEQLRAFWKHFQTCTHESIRWPHCYEDDCIPIGLHGDDLRYTETGQKLLCVSLNFLLDESQERYPLFVIRIVSRSMAVSIVVCKA